MSVTGWASGWMDRYLELVDQRASPASALLSPS